jgi:hypothetical protein
MCLYKLYQFVNSTDRTSDRVSSHKKILFLPTLAAADKVLVLALECEMDTQLFIEQRVFTCNIFVKYADGKNAADHFVQNFLQ